MRAEDMDASWAAVGPPLVAIASAAQLAAATAATAYVPAVLAQTAQTAVGSPVAIVVPTAFAGVAADGRSLPGLLTSAVVQAKLATRPQSVVDGGGKSVTVPGRAPADALALGGRALDGLLQTVAADAARGATQAEIAVRENVGYVRMVNPPCCGRCAILAGKWFPWNAGFPRHPRCDCLGIPATENVAGSLLTDPRALLESGLVRVSRRERERLDRGDDIYKVINESRDMWRARIAEQKAGATAEERAARDQKARQGLEDLFASTRSRVDAVKAMRDQGYAT